MAVVALMWVGANWQNPDIRAVKMATFKENGKKKPYHVLVAREEAGWRDIRGAGFVNGKGGGH